MSDSMRKVFNIIVAIVVSIGAWTFVVYNNDPTTEVRYKDIPVTFRGEDALANQGLGVSQVSTSSIDVTLKQLRIDTANITADDITVIADVSAAAEGENGISLQISGPENTQVAEAETRSISVEVEAADTAEKNIYVEYEGSYAGYEPVVTNLTSTHATVIGAESEISRVDRIAAQLSYEDTNDKSKKFTVALKALDEDGDEVDHMVIYPREVNFVAHTGATKEVPLNVVTEDARKSRTASDDETEDSEEETGDGYVRTYTAPDTITIKGSSSAIDGVSEVSTELIDIDSMYEDQEVEPKYILPDGVQIANNSKDYKIQVKVSRKSE